MTRIKKQLIYARWLGHVERVEGSQKKFIEKRTFTDLI